jgi:hypothetical protein
MRKRDNEPYGDESHDTGNPQPKPKAPTFTKIEICSIVFVVITVATAVYFW